MGKYNAVLRAAMRDITDIATLTHDPLIIENIKREKSSKGEDKKNARTGHYSNTLRLGFNTSLN